MSRWEWLAGAIGAILVLSAAGFLLHAALTRPDTPADVEITVDAVVPQGGGYLVRFTARNRGSATAAALGIEGELTNDAGTVQTARATIDYLPGGGSRAGALIFDHDPRASVLRLRAVGYEDP